MQNVSSMANEKDKTDQRIARITEALPQYGNRVYRLKFVKGAQADQGRIVLDLNGHDDEAINFYGVGAELLVEVEVHRCRTPGMRELPDAYFVWQPRVDRRPVSCPRCKVRFVSPFG